MPAHLRTAAGASTRRRAQPLSVACEFERPGPSVRFSHATCEQKGIGREEVLLPCTYGSLVHVLQLSKAEQHEPESAAIHEPVPSVVFT